MRCCAIDGAPLSIIGCPGRVTIVDLYSLMDHTDLHFCGSKLSWFSPIHSPPRKLSPMEFRLMTCILKLDYIMVHKDGYGGLGQLV